MRRLRDLPPLGFVLGAFLLSRVVYFLLGIRFDTQPLEFYDQVIDPVLLRTNLAESLLYLHSQPPAFNLLIGIVLKLAPAGSETAIFHALWIAMGIGLAVCTYRLFERLGISSRLAAIITTIFIVSPAAIAYENLLFYTYPIALLLTAAALYLHKHVSEGRWIDGFLCFLMLSIAMLMRSSYHPIWFVAIVLALLFLRRPQWRTTLSTALVPFLLVVALYVKNGVLFGSYSGSTWLGATLHAMTTAQLTPEEGARLVAEKKMSEYALHMDPFSHLDTFRMFGYKEPPKSGIAVLDQEMKSTGYPNNNHLAYIKISKEYQKNSIWMMGSMPMVYLTSVAKAYVVYCYPETAVWVVMNNVARIKALDRAYNLALGQIRPPDAIYKHSEDVGGKIEKLLAACLVVLVGLPFLCFYGARRLWKGLKGEARSSPMTSTLAYIVITVVYSTLIGIVLSIAENSRYRFEIDALFLALVGLLIQGWIEKRGRRTEDGGRSQR